MKKIIIIISMIFILLSCTDKEKVVIDEMTQEETQEINQEINKEINKESINYNILALWDSLTAWYSLEYEDSYPIQLQTLLQKKWYNYKVINAWVSWDTTKNVLARIDLYKEEYDIILLNVWWNDGLRSLDTQESKENILKIIDNFPDSEIVLFSIDLPWNYSVSYRNKIKKVYVDIDEQRDVYFYGLFFEWLDYNTHFLSDWIHPNKEWYKIIAENISDYLLQNNIIKND